MSSSSSAASRTSARRRRRRSTKTASSLSKEAHQARLPRQPVLHPGQVPGARHQDRLLHGAGLRGPRPHAAALDQHRGRPTPSRARARSRTCPPNSSWGRISATTSSTSASTTPRARRWPSWVSISKSCWPTKTSPGSATAVSAGWRPASSTHWRRSKCRRWAMASATSSASSSRRSSTAGRWRRPTSGCAMATPGRSRGRSGAAT